LTIFWKVIALGEIESEREKGRGKVGFVEGRKAD
jgi:hypothetical protein